MSTPDLRDTIENELWRVLIQNHPNYAAFPQRSRKVIDTIHEQDVTPELIYFSQQIIEEEIGAPEFMHVLAGGNPSPNVVLALTNFVLGDILGTLREFGTSRE